MMREIPLEELPKNSWQVDAYERGKVFYGDPRSKTEIERLQRYIELSEEVKRMRPVDTGHIALAGAFE